MPANTLWLEPWPALRRAASMAALRQMVTAATWIVVTPLLVHGLGLQRYGVWVLVTGLTAYAGVADLGMRAAVVKFVAELDARRDRDGLGALVANSLLVYGGLGGLVALLFALASGQVLDLLRIPQALHRETLLLVRMAALQACVSLWLLFAAGYVEGLQRVHVANLVFCCNAPFAGLGMILVLRAGGSLGVLCAVQTASGLATLIALAAYAWRETRRRHGRLRLRPAAGALAASFRYGVVALGSSVAHLGNLHFEKLLLGRWAGLEAASLYDLGLRVALGLRVVPSLLLCAVVPVVSHLSATQRLDEVRRIYCAAMRAVTAALVPLAVFALVCMPRLLQLWLGTSTPEVVLAARVLCLAHLGNALLTVPLFVARGLGRLRFEARTAAAHLGLQVGLGLLLVPAFGLRGALCASACTLLGVAAFGLVWAHRGLALHPQPPLAFLRRQLARPLAASLLALATALVWRTPWAAGMRTPLQSALVLGAGAMLFAAVYLASLAATGFFLPAERAFVARALRGS